VKDKLDQKVRPVVIRTPDHRLRVFVSSTLKELAEEREAARQAILKLRLAPVMFESGARPHPAHRLYQAYLSQSHIFVGIYWQSYGWIAPGAQVSGLEDEYNLSANMPVLIYIKNPAPNREPALARMLERIQDENASCYKYFATPDELRELVEDDLVLLMTEHFEAARGEEQAPGELAPTALTNVPIPRNPLIGRERELELARKLLLSDDVGLVTLTGPGGIGKSRLGIEIALELRDRFRDGVYMVGLESITDPDLVIPTIAKTVGLAEAAGGPSWADLLKRYLRNKQVLLLLDNFEQVLPAAPRIADLLESCPEAKILVSSRASLHLRAEKELPVPPLAIPPLGLAPDLQPLSQYSAVQLFIQRAQGVHPDFQVTNENAPAVAEICHRLDGLPLAIELASARSRLLSPQALLVRLEHRFELLRGGTRDLPERQHTLYSAIDWSYNLLNEDERRLLRRLSVFAGGWTLEGAEAVCYTEGEQPMEALDGLEILTDNSLLRAPEGVDGDTRLRMLETIREFAHERLTGSGEADAIHDRHARYFLSIAERAETEMRQSARQAWYQRLEAELDNFRAAMDWLLEHDQSELALRIGMALWIFWWTRGYRREGLQWLEKGLASTGSVTEAVRAKALNRAGFLTRDLGDYARAVVMLQESLALWRQIDDQAGIALSLDNLGTTVMRQGDYAGATVMLEEALDLRRRLSDQHGTYATLHNLGLVASWQGSNERAIELYGESLALARVAQDDHNLGIILTNLGEQYSHQGDCERAEACYAEAASIYQRLGNRAGEADVMRNRGVIALKQSDYTRASDLLVETILAFQEMDDRENTIWAIEALAAVAKEQHLSDRAARLLGASDSLRQTVGVARAHIDQVDFDACLASVRGQLGEGAFGVAWAEGSRMTFEQTVAYAVDRRQPIGELSL
jgi:predicted ATPase